MNTVNLLPVRRIALRRRREAIRRWVLIDSICAAALCGAAVMFFVRSGSAEMRPDAMAAPGSLSVVAADYQRLAAESSALQSRLESLQHLAASPDWSLLLAALSQATGDDIYFESLDCQAAPLGAETSTRGVRIAGVGRSQRAVTEFVLRLEAMQLFSGVTLSHTAPRAAGGGDTVAFEIDCKLPEAGERQG